MLLGENEAIARDFMKHYRSSVPHVLDFDYDSFEQFGARSWPAYVIASHEGEVVAQTIGIGRARTEVDKFRAAVNRALEGQAEVFAEEAGAVVCEDGICRITTEGEPPVRETDPCLVAASGGGFWLAYCSDQDGDNNVYLRRYSDGKPGEPMVVTRSMADDYAPAIACGADGRVWVTWASNRTGKYDVYLRSYDGDAWSDEIRVTESADDAMRPSVAVDLDGRVWVTYYAWNRNFMTSRDRDVFVRWLHEGELSDEMLVSPAEPAIEDHTDPVVVADPARGGRVWVAWSWDYHPQIQEDALDTDMPSIFATPVELDGPAGAPRLVGTRGESHAAVDLWPSLAFDPEGNLWCAWDLATLRRIHRGAVVARLEGGGEEFSAPDRVGEPGGELSDPALSIGADGTRVLAWTAREDGRWRLHASSASGSSLGGWKAIDEDVLVEGDVRAPATLVLDGAAWIAFEEREGHESRVRLLALPID